MTIKLFLTYTFLQVHTAGLERQARTLNTLEKHLSANTFFVGERITLADIFIAALMQRSVSLTIDAAVRAKIPNVIRHLETIVNQPNLKEIYGAVEYIEKGIQFVPPPKEKKEAKPAAAPAPKAEKKPKAKDDDEDEPDVPPEPKAKNPLDDLPKSTFNLEDWKRAYSNKDTRGAGGALEWLYEKFVFAFYTLKIRPNIVFHQLRQRRLLHLEGRLQVQ
jgi:elongation factor 1-gamma